MNKDRFNSAILIVNRCGVADLWGDPSPPLWTRQLPMAQTCFGSSRMNLNGFFFNKIEGYMAGEKKPFSFFVSIPFPKYLLQGTRRGDRLGLPGADR